MSQPDYLPIPPPGQAVPVERQPVAGQPIVAPGWPVAPTGWHPDPAGGPLLRYFDGQQWTNHTAPPPPQYHAAAAPGAVAVAVANGGGPNHALHAILTLITCGLWLPIWIIVAFLGGRSGGTGVSITR
jgi:hypothetical protein